MGKKFSVDTTPLEVLKPYVRRLFSPEAHREMSFSLKLSGFWVPFWGLPAPQKSFLMPERGHDGECALMEANVSLCRGGLTCDFKGSVSANPRE